MEEQIQESLLEAKQARQIQQDLSLRVAALEPKSDKIPVSHAKNPLFIPHSHEQRHQIFHTAYKMGVPRFDGTDPLRWILKITHLFLTSIILLRNNVFLLHHFI